jgi:hypothetical protein
MRKGFRIVDIDTHVNPNYDTLVKYLDPDARSRVDEFQPFVRTRSSNGTTSRVLHVAPYPFDRFPGEAPREAKVVAGGKGALEGRVTSSSSHHRVPPAVGVQDENVHDRIKDMDAEGRDLDFLIPGTWATAVSGLPDITLTEALYRSYHNYIAAYCQAYPSRLKSMILVPGGNVEWAVKEVSRLKNERWVAAVATAARGQTSRSSGLGAPLGCDERRPSANLLPQLFLRAAVLPRLSRHLGQCCDGAHGRPSVGCGAASLLPHCRADL